MRKIIYGINLTVDGCCEHTKLSGSDEMHDYFTDLMSDIGLLLYGRKTYQLMVPYWPDVVKNPSDNESANKFAQVFDSLDKVVFSRTLNTVEGNTTVFRSNLEEEVLKLKKQPGKNISIGGVDLPSQLMAMGLIDEYYFLVHPTIGGQGRRLFEDTVLEMPLNVKLIESKVLPSGAISLHYSK
ncbi:MAG: dihydrofolate reductase family protein [Bacteroidota bacterium]